MGRRIAILELRPYQKTALNVLWSALQVESNVLLEAACSAGKTLLFSKIAQRLLEENPSFRILILMDREVLVTQTRDAIIEIVPELQMDIGIVCASVSNHKITHKRITIASRQSLINQLNEFEAVQLIIIDEAHLMAVPKQGKDEVDQYGQIIKTLQEYNPKVRMLAVTATPYRLSDGYIYGNKNVQGARPYFPEVHHRITVGELEKEGYLAPLKGKTICTEALEGRLSNVALVAGEYNIGTISDIMSEGIHVKSAVEAWKEHASDRKKTIAFCVTIVHAEKMAEAFNNAGISAVAIHSGLDDLTNYARMESLKNGGHKVFCSVAKLTTGMDVPDIDTIIMARPTKSAALYKQILGRGQRIAEGKTDCLVLDMVGNNGEFGTDLDNLKIRYRQGVDGEGKAVNKECPGCEADLHPAVRICPECDYEFPRTDDFEADNPEMTDATYGSQPPEWMDVEHMFVNIHKSKGSGKELLRIRLEGSSLMKQPPNLWLCFPEDGYTGFAVEKGKSQWYTLTDDRIPPKSASDALERLSEIRQPDSILVDDSSKFPEIKEIKYNPKEETLEEIQQRAENLDLDFEDIPF